MKTAEIRDKYIKFFEERGHAHIPSASLRPENDPTTLFTGSGMQPLLPYLLGEKHPKGTRLVNSQKAFRAEDIEEVGDNRHTTFFEMLGNWSLGEYFKKEQLPWFFEFLTNEVGLSKDRLWVTCFAGDESLGIPKDTESAEIWKGLGIPEERICYYDAKKNWWSRSGTPDKMPAGEPGGPDSEVFYDFGTEHDSAFGAECHPNCDCGRFVEIGNSVFMEYIKKEDGSFEPLPQKNVDFGGGLERITAAANQDPDVFNVDSLNVVIEHLSKVSGKSYLDEENKESFRVIADHMRAAIFMIVDGVVPTNTDAGYFTRRLIRRAVRHMDKLGVDKETLHGVVAPVVEVYEGVYPELTNKKADIERETALEEERFRATLGKGLKQLEKAKGGKLSGKEVFTLFSTYGFPLELTLELAPELNIEVDVEGFKVEMASHQELSRAGAEQKFKGGLADGGETTTQLHTATHLMLAGLRKYLGDNVHQAGSNITTERTRFDFTHPEKVDRETLDKVEKYVNDAIAANAVMELVEMPKKEAKASGVEGSFWEKYPDTVQVYTLKSKDGTVWSRELCGGPHVKNTSEIKGTFKITKEESSSAGVRRVKALLE
ncbi:MAG: alanine--tRNA ligase [Candidatus Pacebacteria bacterium]|jgi:alanyl-tRNA synthetase|nr:alanine--tRNA ligase [Candidatus Paceibacterota bacterium]MDP6659607.1 alanine--tRNA ligase [Candidatus Paceibacterota bacterium]|tara:strand:- start:36870 stop:38672 length:1803 start_codon:yes stop_codon:yes gene_type:complete